MHRAIFLCDIAKNVLPSPQFSIIVDKNKTISRFEIQYAAITDLPRPAHTPYTSQTGMLRFLAYSKRLRALPGWRT